MTIQVSASQIEALEAVASKAVVAATTVEAVSAAPNPTVRVAGAQVEYSFVQANMPVKVHGSQIEILDVLYPGPVRTHGVQIEALVPLPEDQTPVHVSHMSIEVLRSIPDKKRRPPMNVVAN